MFHWSKSFSSTLSRYSWCASLPRSQKKLVSFLIANHGHKISEAEALNLIENLLQAGHLTIGEKGAVTYLLESE